jgi:hypothetical protein
MLLLISLLQLYFKHNGMEHVTIIHSYSLVLVGLVLYILSLSYLCASRDFMMRSREKCTLSADIVLFCIAASSSSSLVNLLKLSGNFTYDQV